VLGSAKICTQVEYGPSTLYFPSARKSYLPVLEGVEVLE